MNYLDETMLELKAMITNTYHCWKDAKTDQEVNEKMETLMESLRKTLVESFKNGVSAGRQRTYRSKQKNAQK